MLRAEQRIFLMLLIATLVSAMPMADSARRRRAAGLRYIRPFNIIHMRQQLLLCIISDIACIFIHTHNSGIRKHEGKLLMPRSRRETFIYIYTCKKDRGGALLKTVRTPNHVFLCVE